MTRLAADRASLAANVFFRCSLAASIAALATVSPAAEPAFALRGAVVDDQTGRPLAARLYIQSSDRTWFFAKSESPDGAAVELKRERGEQSVEMHTSLTAHPFTAMLPPGRYTVTAERGKEYFPEQAQVTIADKACEVELRLRRWVDMESRGWYSGDTHVHRSLSELPAAALAEDLNVTLPLTYWVTTSDTTPVAGNRYQGPSGRPQLIRLDDTHVIWPVNTEYEIFSVGPKQHTLGAVLAINHRRPFDLGVPPVRPVAEQARNEGALLDLEKHSWPWSLMLVPVMNVDLFELSNNHMWRTEFAFEDWTLDAAPRYMHLEMQPEGGFTEWGWLDFGFQTYYGLLNCGFRLRPTAGTAAGVHPVPLGFSRVYVRLPDGFDYEAWMRGLDAGRSFVTTGPMLQATFNGEDPGHTFAGVPQGRFAVRVAGEVRSAEPLDRIEIVHNGVVRRLAQPANDRGASNEYVNSIDARVDVDGTSWLAVRCFEALPGGRFRFAHTSPVHVEMPGRPLHPRPEEIEFMISRMREEIARNEPLLSPAGLDEFRQALAIYEKIAEEAR